MKRKLLLLTMLVMFVSSTSLFAQNRFVSCVENEMSLVMPENMPATFTTANAFLPDPFTMLDGNRMTTKEQWQLRRLELLRLLERTVYGSKPETAVTTGTVTRNGASATISVTVVDRGVTETFSVAVTLPSATGGPFPLLLRMSNSGASDSQFRTWGVATANAPSTAPETTNRNNQTGPFYRIYGAASTTGSLAGQAWGVSRVIDVIQQSDGSILKWDAVAVTGCSREGKKALAAGVLDQRVALTIPMEGGTGGSNIMRRAYKDRPPSGTDGSQSPNSAYTEQNWLGADFGAFTGNPDLLPVDMHEAIALIAPRGVFFMDKTASSAGYWLGIPCSQSSAHAAAEVYKALGVGGNLHYMNTPTQGHCQGQDSYNTQLKNFVDIFLFGTADPGAAPIFTETPVYTQANQDEWVNWTTPTLSGSLPSECGEPVVGYVLTTSASPAQGGSVSRNPAPPANQRYEEGTQVSLTPVAAEGWGFIGWSGAATGNAVPLVVTMDESKAVTANFELQVDGTENLVGNGTFAGITSITSSSSPWRWQAGTGGAGTVSVSGGKATINITSVGAQVYQPQLLQQGRTLTNGWKYRFKFTASAAEARTVEVLFQMSSSPYSTYAAKTFNLTTEEQEFTWEFQMSGATDTNTQMAFNCGGTTQRIVLSNVSLYSIINFSGLSDISTDEFKLRPVVLEDIVNVNFTAAGNETELRLYDMMGSVVASEQMQTIAGGNYTQPFSHGKLSSGVYIVWMRSDAVVKQAKVLVK